MTSNRLLGAPTRCVMPPTAAVGSVVSQDEAEMGPLLSPFLDTSRGPRFPPTGTLSVSTLPCRDVQRRTGVTKRDFTRRLCPRQHLLVVPCPDAPFSGCGARLRVRVAPVFLT